MNFMESFIFSIFLISSLCMVFNVIPKFFDWVFSLEDDDKNYEEDFPG